MKRTIIDAGPIIALFDKSDLYHQKSIEFLREYRGRLVTSCAVITEVMYMLNFNTLAQTDFLRWLNRDTFDILSLTKECIPRLIELTEKYSDVPMDFADASLIILSEQCAIAEIISIDTDFYIYRNVRNEHLKNVFIHD